MGGRGGSGVGAAVVAPGTSSFTKWKSVMGNSKKPEGSGGKGKKNKLLRKNMEAHPRRAGQTSTVDAGATARGAIAITRNGLEATNGIHIRALKQRDASLAEAAEVKSSLEAVSCQMQDQSKACSPTDQPVQKFKDSLGSTMTVTIFFTFRTE